MCVIKKKIIKQRLRKQIKKEEFKIFVNFTD